ncbi:TetR/AcrR family transcriptional regulator [Gordonia sp. VNK21]|uniref:TetR/AcrR family transcriptional regulator n=1 Tax=Gordonia sp. VNK21 TaxID=3382483 RepID=UPI0038D4FBA6
MRAAETGAAGGQPSAAPDPAPPARELPLTERGMRTRAALIAAARTVFETKGFLDARLIDITTEAQCAAGTFYTYFSSKEEIFAAVLEQAKEDMLHPGTERVDADSDPVAIITASNRAYLEAYRRNAKLMGLMEQVASIDPGFRELRERRGNAFVERNARSIADLQRRGLADTGLDPLLAARALSGMISRLAFEYFVTGSYVAAGGAQEQYGFDELVQTASRLWTNALQIPRAG